MTTATESLPERCECGGRMEHTKALGRTFSHCTACTPFAKPLRAYIVYVVSPDEGAVLVFAHTGREAKRMAWPLIEQWGGCDWLDLRVRWLREGAEYHRRRPGPHAIEAPESCRSCERWYAAGLDEDGLCAPCAEEAKMSSTQPMGGGGI